MHFLYTFFSFLSLLSAVGPFRCVNIAIYTKLKRSERIEAINCQQHALFHFQKCELKQCIQRIYDHSFSLWALNFTFCCPFYHISFRFARFFDQLLFVFFPQSIMHQNCNTFLSLIFGGVNYIKMKVHTQIMLLKDQQKIFRK